MRWPPMRPPGEPMLERLVYVSRACGTLDARAVHDIVRVAANRNRPLALTGALIFVDGHFLQVLEGEAMCIDQRFARIAADPRHLDLDVRWRGRVETRAFAEDWMALRQDRDVPPALRERFGYRPGLPADAFPAERLVAFARACCAPLLTASAGA